MVPLLLLLLLNGYLMFFPIEAGCGESRICCPGRNMTCIAYDDVLISVLPDNDHSGDEYTILGADKSGQAAQYDLNGQLVKRDLKAATFSKDNLANGYLDDNYIPANANRVKSVKKKSTAQFFHNEMDDAIEPPSVPHYLPEIPTKLFNRRNNICFCDEACVQLNDCCSDYGNVCPVVNCHVSQWTSWSACQPKNGHNGLHHNAQQHCGVGVSHRYRDVLRSPSYGGSECPVLKQQRGCYDDSGSECAKLLHEVAYILPYKYSTARSLKKPSNIFYDLPKVYSKLQSIKSYCVIFETSWASKHCPEKEDSLTAAGHQVCVECDARTQLGYRKDRCKGHGVGGKKSVWNMLFAKYCFGQWKQVDLVTNCICKQDRPHLARYTFA